MEKKYIIMNEADNCSTSLEDLPEGTAITGGGIDLILNQAISLGHKFALKDIQKGENIIKYGQIIGTAIKKINRGDWIHTHNIKSAYLEGEEK